MQGLTINISWEYFLGIFAGLIAIAWYSGGRFNKIEESIKWLKDTVNEIKTSVDNQKTPVFTSQSPLRLNDIGKNWLVESGLKDYIDTRRKLFLKYCEDKKNTNPYEVQQCIFSMFDTLKFEQDIENKLEKFAYEKGTTMNVVRRVGAIYLRDLCIKEYGMETSDIDTHDPNHKKD